MRTRRPRAAVVAGLPLVETGEIMATSVTTQKVGETSFGVVNVQTPLLEKWGKLKILFKKMSMLTIFLLIHNDVDKESYKSPGGTRKGHEKVKKPP
jgi:hypothetical protein